MQQGERAHRLVDTVLRSHDAGVRDQERLAATESRVGLTRSKAIQIGVVSNDEDVLRRFDLGERDSAIRVIRRDGHVGERECEALQSDRQPVEGALRPTEP